MASNTDGSPRSPAYKLIHHYRTQAMAAIEQYNDELIDGTTSLATTEALAKAALNYHDVLHEHRDENALEEPWTDRGVSWIRDVAGETVTISTNLNQANAATEYAERPRILATDPAKIKRTILELNDIAKELGFGAEAREATPKGKATMDDLKALLRGRGQTEALQHLPGEEDENDGSN